ncbi:MAG: patatin-like phospholipase family protein [Pseudomonadota bacterium]
MAKKLGLVLGSGAARGWAHIGVLRALKEIGVAPQAIAGCSVGALVGGAHLIGALDEFERWARTLKPLSAMQQFSFKVHHGGFIDTAPAFDAFRGYDKNIEDLSVDFAAVAADLATGDEVVVTEGSVIDAARASSAIPVVFHAVQVKGRWLVDGALTNPAPVSVARAMGADIVISVDLNAVPRVLKRFEPSSQTLPAPMPEKPAAPETMTGAVTRLIDDTREAIERQVALAKARAHAKPHLFETAYAAADIFQMHLARARAKAEPPDLLIKPDMRDAMPTAFDRADEFIGEGYRAMMEHRDQLEALLSE